jgi:hypothetical protein
MAFGVCNSLSSAGVRNGKLLSTAGKEKKKVTKAHDCLQQARIEYSDEDVVHICICKVEKHRFYPVDFREIYAETVLPNCGTNAMRYKNRGRIGCSLQLPNTNRPT